MSPAVKRCIQNVRAALDDLEDQMQVEEAHADEVLTRLANGTAENNRLRQRIAALEQSASGARSLQHDVDPKPRPGAGELPE